jgi:hypothetical protein
MMLGCPPVDQGKADSEIPEDGDPETDYQPDEDDIINWYTDNCESYENILSIVSGYEVMNLPANISGYSLDGIDSEQYPHEYDKIAYLCLNQKGYDTVTCDYLLTGMVIPERFFHSEKNNTLLFENYIIEKDSDRENLLSSIESEPETYSLGIRRTLDNCPIGDNYISVISGIILSDYSSIIADYSYDQQMYDLYLTQPDYFKSKYGNCFGYSATFGCYCYDLTNYELVTLGDHSRNEVICAIKLLHSKGAELTDEEIFWYKWVLGYFDSFFLYENYPKLYAVNPARISSFLSYSISTDNIALRVEDVKNYIASGKINELHSSMVNFTYKKYDEL